MKQFVVDPAEFYAAGKVALSTPDDRECCRATIGQLIARYDLHHRHVLSVGGGTAHEEYWFLQAGCDLTVVDLDEHGRILPYLERLRLVPEDTASAQLRYVVGDALEWSKTIGIERRFDVCYFSSFTVDEMHRARVQEQARTLPWRLRRAVSDRLGIEIGSRRLWPPSANPFTSLVMDIVDRSLAPHGLLVNQSYYCGVDIPDNPQFIGCMRRQLRSIGVELIELYHFHPQFTDVSLTVGLRASPEEARAYATTLRGRPSVTNFHGRSTVERTVKLLSLLP